jgi:hypothetical protein
MFERSEERIVRFRGRHFTATVGVSSRGVYTQRSVKFNHFGQTFELSANDLRTIAAEANDLADLMEVPNGSTDGK